MFDVMLLQEKWVADFADQWDPYDWTKQLG